MEKAVLDVNTGNKVKLKSVKEFDLNPDRTINFNSIFHYKEDMIENGARGEALANAQELEYLTKDLDKSDALAIAAAALTRTCRLWDELQESIKDVSSALVDLAHDGKVAEEFKPKREEEIPARYEKKEADHDPYSYIFECLDKMTIVMNEGFTRKHINEYHGKSIIFRSPLIMDTAAIDRNNNDSVIAFKIKCLRYLNLTQITHGSDVPKQIDVFVSEQKGFGDCGAYEVTTIRPTL